MPIKSIKKRRIKRTKVTKNMDNREAITKKLVEYFKTESGCMKINNPTEKMTVFDLLNPENLPIKIWCNVVEIIGDDEAILSCNSVRITEKVTRVSLMWR